MGERRLTLKQARFVEAYLGEANGNATQAARIAGYAGNTETLCTVGSENLGKPAVQAALERRRHELAAMKDSLTPERILAAWTAIVTDPNTSTRDKLVALRDAAKALGVFVKSSEPVDDQAERVVIYLPDNGRDPSQLSPQVDDAS